MQNCLRFYNIYLHVPARCWSPKLVNDSYVKLCARCYTTPHNIWRHCRERVCITIAKSGKDCYTRETSVWYVQAFCTFFYCLYVFNFMTSFLTSRAVKWYRRTDTPYCFFIFFLKKEQAHAVGGGGIWLLQLGLPALNLGSELLAHSESPSTSFKRVCFTPAKQKQN